MDWDYHSTICIDLIWTIIIIMWVGFTYGLYRNIMPPCALIICTDCVYNATMYIGFICGLIQLFYYVNWLYMWTDTAILLCELALLLDWDNQSNKHDKCIGITYGLLFYYFIVSVGYTYGLGLSGALV